MTARFFDDRSVIARWLRSPQNDCTTALKTKGPPRGSPFGYFLLKDST